MIIVSLLFVSLALAGGRREQSQEEQPEPAPPTPRQRIEFGREDRSDQDATAETQDETADAASLWLLVIHELREEMAGEVSTLIQQGYVPVGIERIPEKGVGILYIRSNDLEVRRWRLTEIEDLTTLNDELTALIANGWIPMDITTVDGRSLTVLLLDVDLEITGWQITLGPPETEEILSTYERYRNQGYIAYGVSVDSLNRMWYLFLRFDPGQEVSRPLLNAFKAEDLSDGINRDISNHAMPWALGAQDELFFIQYLF